MLTTNKGYLGFNEGDMNGGPNNYILVGDIAWRKEVAKAMSPGGILERDPRTGIPFSGIFSIFTEAKFMSHTQEVLGALELKVVHARGSKRKQKNPVTDRTAFCGSWGGIKPAVLKAYLLGL